MKKEIFQRGVSRHAVLSLLILLASFNAKAVDVAKTHGELHGLWGFPNYGLNSGWRGGNVGGITVEVYLGFEVGGTLAEVRFQGDGNLNYTSWPGTGNLSFTETSGSAKMFVGFETSALWRLQYPGWGFNAGWPIGWVQVVPSINQQFNLPGLPNLDYALSDETSCDNYLLGDSVTLSDSFNDIQIIEVPIGYPHIFSGNVGASLSSDVTSTIDGLRLNTSVGTFTNEQTRSVSLSSAAYAVNNISQTSRGSIALDLTPNLTLGVTVGPFNYTIPIPITTFTIPVTDTEFTSSARSITFTNSNTAQAITLAASETVCVGTNAGATLNGTVNPGALLTTAWFEWGATTSYGHSVAVTNLGKGQTTIALANRLESLVAGLTYHYRMVASNSVGMIFGADQTFGPLFLTLNGDSPLILPSGTPFTDPGATVTPLPVAISAGVYHGLALKSDGTVVGWGWNAYGQTTIPASATNVIAVAGGAEHSLALRANGTVVGWGHNHYNQTSIPASVTNAVAIAAGYYHSLALKADGTVVGWGRNDSGQTTTLASATNVVAIAAGLWHSLALKADGTIVGSGPPGGLTNGVAVAASDQHSIALKLDGTIVAWGDNLAGQATPPASATNVVAVAAGWNHNLALKADGTIVAWGDNWAGQTNTPANATNVVAIAASGAYNLVLKADGTIIGWGDNGYGQTNVPVELQAYSVAVTGTVNTNVPGIYTLTYWATNVSGVVASATRTVVVTGAPIATTLPATDVLTIGTNASVMLNGTVNPGGLAAKTWFEWGNSASYGHTSAMTDISSGGSLPVSNALTGLMAGVTYHYRVVASNTVGIAFGADQVFRPLFLTLIGDNPLACQVGSGYADPSFDVMGDLSQPLAVAAGGFHSLALKADGSVVGWGANSSGQATSPASATNVIAISAGYVHSLALKADGSLVAWGYGSQGQTTIPASATNVVAIDAGYNHSLARKVDGSVIGWGFNGQGQTTVPASMTNAVGIAAGGFHSLGLKADGSVVGWGQNNYGQRTIPASATNAVAIAAGMYHSLALKSDGSLIAWGNNDYGQTNVPASATNVAAIAAGWHHSLAITSDGRVVGWGNNTYGQTTVPASATNAVAVAAGGEGERGFSLMVKASGAVLGWGYNGSGQTNVPGGFGVFVGTTGVTSTVNTNMPGSYTLTYWATNALGAVASATRTVVVSSPPAVTNLLVTGVFSQGTNASAALTGLVNPRGLATTAWFEWGTNTNYGHTTAWSGVGSGWDLLPVNNPLADLAAGAIYHCRLAASNRLGVTYSSDQSFSTLFLALNGTNSIIHQYGVAFADSGSSLVDPGMIPARAIAAGVWFSLALKNDGTVFGWGYMEEATTWVPASATNVTAIAAGEGQSVALKADGTVVTWGYIRNGDHTVPTGLSNVMAVAAGGHHCLALRSNGTVVAWGNNDHGEINVPPGLSNVIAIKAAGGNSGGMPYGSSLALKADGTVVGWGYNNAGQIDVPVGLSNVVTIAAGRSHSFALKEDGAVVGWGDNSYGQANIPPGLSNVVAIAAGGGFSLALTSNGTVALWGFTRWGELDVPAGLNNVVSISALAYHCLALKADGTIAAWGGNSQGQTNVPALYRSHNVSVTGSVNPNLPGNYTLTYWITNAWGAVATTTRTITVTPPAPPVFAGCSMPAPGQFRLQAAGTAGLTYTLQTSTNLVDWVNHTNLMANPGGLIVYLENVEADAPSCFYRLKWP